MSTAVASFVAPTVDRHISPPQYPSLASATAAPTSSEREPAPKRIRSDASPSSPDKYRIVDRSTSREKVSPTSATTAAPPVIKVKKEPGSPAMSSRPRPKRLDLSSATSNSRAPHSAAQTSRPSAPLTSRESAGLQVQDMGLACLSPGFQTNDPTMREQLQRSLDVRDQQRQIIEARQKGAKPGSAHESDPPSRTQDTNLFGVQARTPTTSRRRGPPPGLSIAAPSASHFAHDRVIQSAPLNQTFTGLRPGDQAYSRHVQHGPSALSQTSHMHHVAAVQTNNRLPPIADVFANDRLDVQRNFPQPHSPSNVPPAAPSPGFPPSSQQQQQQHPSLGSRGREFRSAEEAVAGLSGGRDDLMPKVVHYGGVQPPTPPSPLPHSGSYHHQQPYTTSGAPHSNNYSESTSRPDILARTSSMNGRRRGRAEFERDNGSPPSSSSGAFPSMRGVEAKRMGYAVRGDDEMVEDWMAGMTGQEKKDEFLRLCERAWDLFHS